MRYAPPVTPASPPPPAIPPLRHAQALLILGVYLVLGTLGTPGLDFLKPNDLRHPKDQAALRAQVGSPWADLGIGVAWLNRTVRLPLAERFAPIQKPFRISQSWALYRDGPGKVRRLEVWVDGVLRHRSADPDYPWLAPQLRNRRVRPMVESTTMKANSPNWEGLARYITRQALAEDPGVQRVELVATEGPFPGRRLEPQHRIVAQAPSWTPELQP